MMDLNNWRKIILKKGNIKQDKILDEVLGSDITRIQRTLSNIDRDAFKNAVDTILKGKRIYIVGIRSCAPLAEFLAFYLNMVCDNVVLVKTSSASEIFEQLIHIGERDVIIGISFPRYSMRTLKALEFASHRQAKVITLTDDIHSPINIYSSCCLVAQSEMVSVADSLVAPLSVINALVTALYMKRKKDVLENLETLDTLWEDYQVYQRDEMNLVEDKITYNYIEEEEE